MEHLNHRQFNYEAPTIAWDRHNYRSTEELKELWKFHYDKAITNLNKVIKENSE